MIENFIRTTDNIGIWTALDKSIISMLNFLKLYQ